MSNEYRDRVRQLEQELQKISSTHNSEQCISTTMMVSAAVPIATFIAFYVAAPYFKFLSDDTVPDAEGNPVRSTKKVLLWTAIVTAVVWGCIYGYSVYKGTNTGLFCLRSE